MYSQNHQQGHSARLNGAGRGMPNMLYGYQQHTQHQHPSQAQHLQGMQHDHGMPSSNGLGHHSAFGSGALSSSNQFSSNLQNGHSSGSRNSGPHNEMWQEQLRLHKEAERAHSAMTDQQQPHYYARLKASENRGIGGPVTTNGRMLADGEGDVTERRAGSALEKDTTRQDWLNMDMSGQGLRNLAPELFRYQFLNDLYIASNKLSRLPKAIGELRQLRLLDASFNQITTLPAELGMCTYLKHLLFFNNNIQDLPYELGSLHLLEVLGIEGNPLDHSLKQEIMDKGTKALVNALRESAPGMFLLQIRAKTLLTSICNSVARTRTPQGNHHPGGRIDQPGANQGLLVEYSVRQVCHGANVRIYAYECSQVGVPLQLYHEGAAAARRRLPGPARSFYRGF